MSEDRGLVYSGMIKEIHDIPGADFVVSATVVCGIGGRWRGVVRKADFNVGDLCTVYLPDALIPESDEMRFMEKQKWRVRMQRFKGCASEVVIMPEKYNVLIGYDLTELEGVKKYFKPVPVNLQGQAKGEFPSFIPKTDELNYQMHGDIVDKLVGKHYYITEKADGSSSTAFKYKNEFGVCSRNWQLVPDDNNGYWKIARKYDLEKRLPEGIAVQWETCGPGIQSNPMGLKEVEGFIFSGYNILESRYLEMTELFSLVDGLKIPMVNILKIDSCFSKDGIELLGEGKYLNGKPREGVVVRSQMNYENGRPISFKVINLDYQD